MIVLVIWTSVSSGMYPLSLSYNVLSWIVMVFGI